MCLLSQCSWETDVHENPWVLTTREVITRDPQPGLSSGPCTHDVEHIPTHTLFIFKNWMLELCSHLKSWLLASLGVSTEVAEPDLGFGKIKIINKENAWSMIHSGPLASSSSAASGVQSGPHWPVVSYVCSMCAFSLWDATKICLPGFASRWRTPF